MKETFNLPPDWPTTLKSTLLPIQQKPEVPFPVNRPFSWSAVVLPLIYKENAWNFVFIRRAEHLKNHPGEVAWPGGMLESGESTSQAGIRELEEEIAVPKDQVELLGSLPPRYTGNQAFCIHPFVGLIPSEIHFQPDPREVEFAFEVPVHEFLKPKAVSVKALPTPYSKYRTHIFPWQNQVIWGTTAAILVEFLQAAFSDREWPPVELNRVS